MKTIHISVECYPLAKVGGLADVVGALPKYQNQLGCESMVIMPFHNTKYTQNNEFKEVFTGQIRLGSHHIDFQILALKNVDLGFEVYCVHIPTLLYRTDVYCNDDSFRFLAFQVAALDWILQMDNLPNIVHCHDHHSGLIPFMMSNSFRYERLRQIPSVLTIHNGQYQGWTGMETASFIPHFKSNRLGYLMWKDMINPLASAIKCAWKVTTVSPSYMEELMYNANGLEALLRHEYPKCVGILNGIDSAVWNPKTDDYLVKNYSIKTSVSGKKANKAFLCEQFNLDPTKPLFAFIGRLVGEKAADLLPYACDFGLQSTDINMLVLGSGDPNVEYQLNGLKEKYEGRYNAFIGYDEKLSHIMYAGADFLLMPSRVEPCGLNQMYALRYGTVPIVNRVGGLKDTVVDFSLEHGFGVTHDNASVADIVNAIQRSVYFYSDTKRFKKNQKEIMAIDHSWDKSAQDYFNLYSSFKQN